MEENSHHKDAEMHHKKEGHKNDLLKNYWAVAAIVLAVLLLGMIVNLYNNSGISSTEAGQKVVDLAKLQGVNAKAVSTTEEGSLYKVTIDVNGQQQPVYITKDGKNVAFQVLNLDEVKKAQPATQEPAKADVPKTDKPKVELFIMSYCPYGTQNQKGILPVLELLKNKIDFDMKFVYYIMHGEKEITENTVQYCIDKEQEDKLLPYLKCFLAEGKSAECLASTNVDKTKLNVCVAAADSEFKISANLKDKVSWMSGQFPKYNVHLADNNKYQIGGSPTLIINGKEVSARVPAQILGLVCNAFNNPPEECKQILSSETPSPMFGFSTSGSNTAAAECGN